VISEKLACKLYVFCAAASVVVVVVVVVVVDDDDDAVGGSGGDRCAYVSVLLLSMIKGCRGRDGLVRVMMQEKML
jgi:hypothetical protein